MLIMITLLGRGFELATFCSCESSPNLQRSDGQVKLYEPFAVFF